MGASCAALAATMTLVPEKASAGTYTASNEAELRSAITAANAEAGPSTITLTGDIVMSSLTAFPAATKPITIDTNGHSTHGFDQPPAGTGSTYVGGSIQLVGITLINSGAMTGGTGDQVHSASGGYGVSLLNNGALINNGTITGGTGGTPDASGGTGAGLIGGSHVNNGTIRGGASLTGNGGTGVSLSGGSFVNNDLVEGGASGGSGVGVGIGLSGTAALTNNGTIRGGNPATPTTGVGPVAVSGSANGTYKIINNGTIEGGSGGIAIYAGDNPFNNTFANYTIINDGTIRAGTGQPVAIRFSTHANSVNVLELHSNSVIEGNVVATAAGAKDTLRLAGTGANQIDISHYLNFDIFEKNDTGTWTLTGTTPAVTPWKILGGTLSVASEGALGAASGALTLDGGTLQVTGTSFTNTTRNIVWGPNGGGFDIVEAGNNFTVGQSLTGGGPLTKLGLGTLTLTGNNSYSGGTQVRGGTLVAQGGNAIGDLSSVFVFDGGTFRVADDETVATLAGGGGTVDLDGADLTLGSTFANVTSSYPGSITGTGGLVKQGAFKQVLSGNNSYQGATQILGGTLYAVGAGIDSIPDASAVTVAAGATLSLVQPFPPFTGEESDDETIGSLAGAGNVDLGAQVLTIGGNGANTTFSGVIAGNGGSLIKTGAGTTVLSGANTYTGATTVAAGTLQAGAANVFSQASATVINTGGTLDLGGFSQAIDSVSLAGGTLQNGALTGAVTSTGGTVADLGGSASLTTQVGLTTAQGTNTYTGPTTVAGGTLVVGDDAHAGASLASVVTVNGGGTLSGIGTVGGLAVASGGIVAPGNSIGTLNVAGSASFAPGSIFQVEANAAGDADQIVASGGVAIGGGTVQVLAQGAGFLPQTTYTIIKSGGVNGTFAGVSSNFAFLTPALSYDANDVYLTLTLTTSDDNGSGGSGGTGGGGSGGGAPIRFSSVALTPNQVSVAEAVQHAGLGNTVYNAVVGQTVAGARQAFNALSGEIYASAQGVMLDDSRYIREAVGDRLRQGLAPETGALAALAPTGPALAYAPQPVIKGPLGKDAAQVPAVLAPAYALWGEGFGAWGRRGSDGNAAGLDTSVGGFVLGADAPVGDAFRVGVAGGYSRTSLDGNTGSSADLDTYYAALYGGGQWGPLGVRLGAAYSWHDLDATRAVVFPGFAETLKGSRDANTTQAFGEIGYRVALGGVALEPFAGLAYVNLETDAFTEQGGAAGLTGLSGSEDVTFTSLGVRAAQRWLVGATTALTLRGTVGWQHAFGDTTPSAAFLFAGGSLPFTVAGVPIAEDALVVKAGADLDIGPAVTLGIAYSAQFAQDAQDQQVKGVLNVKF
jgi:outer membrane autotransporter protein